MIFQPHPTPNKTGKYLKRQKPKRCAASVRVEWRHFQIHSSDDDLIGGETKKLYLGRTTDIQEGKTDIQEGQTDIQEGKTDIQEETTPIWEEETTPI